MFSVYVIKSLKNGRLYVGMSSNIEARLTSHNAGQVTSTRAYRPYKLIYKEEVGSSEEARKREMFLKSGQGRKLLGQIIPP